MVVKGTTCSLIQSAGVSVTSEKTCGLTARKTMSLSLTTLALSLVVDAPSWRQSIRLVSLGALARTYTVCSSVHASRNRTHETDS